MKEVKLVNAEAVKIRLCRCFDDLNAEEVKAVLDDIPAVKAEFKAEWLYIPKEPAFYHCSNCLSFSYSMRPICPNCNSTMTNYRKGMLFNGFL